MDQFGVKKPSLKAIAQSPEIPELRAYLKSDGNAKAPVQKVPQANKAFWLGATLQSLEGKAFSAYGVSKEDGGVALVVVPKASAAAQAGLQTNDLIQAVNGRKVSSVDQLFKALVAAGSTPLKLKVVRNQQTMELTITQHPYIENETASTAEGFTKLTLPRSAAGKVSTNQRTNNDPLGSLVDGQLSNIYGPVFGNGVQDGAYKMDMGKVQSVTAITS